MNNFHGDIQTGLLGISLLADRTVHIAATGPCDGRGAIQMALRKLPSVKRIVCTADGRLDAVHELQHGGKWRLLDPRCATDPLVLDYLDMWQDKARRQGQHQCK